MVDKQSNAYIEQKAAYELVHSDAWKIVFRPFLDQVIYNEDKTPIIGLDAAFKAAQAQGRATLARQLVQHVTHLSEAFAKRK